MRSEFYESLVPPRDQMAYLFPSRKASELLSLKITWTETYRLDWGTYNLLGKNPYLFYNQEPILYSPSKVPTAVPRLKYTKTIVRVLQQSVMGTDRLLL